MNKAFDFFRLEKGIFMGPEPSLLIGWRCRNRHSLGPDIGKLLNKERKGGGVLVGRRCIRGHLLGILKVWVVICGIKFH